MGSQTALPFQSVPGSRMGENGQGSEFRDPAFMENRGVRVHRWVPWIAGFSSQFVDDVLRDFLPAKPPHRPLILDPFAGVGTTLIQAVLHGYDAVGFEINPYAVLAARTKLAAASLDLRDLDALIQQVETAPTTLKGNPATVHHRPAGFRSRIPFFSERVEPQVLRLLDLVNGISKALIADLAKMAFGSVMVQVSNYTYEPSLGTRPGAGKPLVEFADVPAVFAAKLRQIREDIAWLKDRVPAGFAGLRREVQCADFLSMNGQVHEGSVDLMVTSPPYMNNYHYVRNTRPQLFWLSLVSRSRDLRRLEESNFGKYWQTVRDSNPIPLRCDHQGLARTVAALRRTRVTHGAYGGPGWANYVTSYFNDADRFMAVLQPALRPGGVGVLVIGNSIIQGIHIPTDQILGDLAQAHGLVLEKIVVLRTKRVGTSITGSSVRRGKKNGTTLYDAAVVVRKR